MSVPVNPALLPPGVTAPVAPAGPLSPARGGGAPPVDGPRFADVLSGAQGAPGARPPEFSRHAVERLQRRGISVDGPALTRLTDGISRAAAKGSRDSVVFLDGTAFVVSIKNNTVITAVGSEHMREHVFTNIDSAVIA